MVFSSGKKKWSPCEIIVWDVCHGSVGRAACLEVEQNALEGETEVAVLSNSDPGNVFQALWKLLCSCPSSQSLTQQWSDVTLQGWLWAVNLSGAWIQWGFVLCLGNGTVALWSRQKKESSYAPKSHFFLTKTIMPSHLEQFWFYYLRYFCFLFLDLKRRLSVGSLQLYRK